MRCSDISKPTAETYANLAVGNEPLLNKVMFIFEALVISAPYYDNLYPDACMTAEQIHFFCDSRMQCHGLHATPEEVDEILNCREAGQVITKIETPGEKPLYRFIGYNPGKRIDYNYTYTTQELLHNK